MAALEADQNTFQTAHSTNRDPDPLADLQVRPRLAREPRGESLFDGVQFSGFNGNRIPADTYDLDNTGSHQERTAMMEIEPAKQISREQGLFDGLNPVRPTTGLGRHGEEALNSLLLQLASDLSFAPGPNLKCIPEQITVACLNGLVSNDLQRNLQVTDISAT